MIEVNRDLFLKTTSRYDYIVLIDDEYSDKFYVDKSARREIGRVIENSSFDRHIKPFEYYINEEYL